MNKGNKVNYMSFLELAKERYSVRSFSGREVEQEKLDKIILAGRVAPTAKNNQPQKVFVVKSPEGIEKINGICRCIYGAPVVLIVAYDNERDWLSVTEAGRRSGETDAAIVCTHMMLEAADLGVGSCWVGMFNNDEVKATFGLPENLRVCALLPIGYPADDAAPSERHTLYREEGDTVAYL